jgi:hypothetical protein
MMPSTDMMAAAHTSSAAAVMASCASTSYPVSHVVHKAGRTKKGRKGDKDAR